MASATDNKTPPELLTVKQVAAQMGVHPNTVRRWERRGILNAFRLPGGHRRFRRSDVETLLQDGSRRSAMIAAEPHRLRRLR